MIILQQRRQILHSNTPELWEGFLLLYTVKFEILSYLTVLTIMSRLSFSRLRP